MSSQPIGLVGAMLRAALSGGPPRLATRRPAPRSLRSLIARRLVSLPRPVCMAVDLLIVVAGTWIGQQAFVWWHPDSNWAADYRLWLVYALPPLMVLLAGMAFGLYERNVLWHRGRIVTRSILTITFAMLATFVIVQVFFYSELSRRTAAFAIVFYMLLATGLRLMAHHMLRYVDLGLLLIGHGPATTLLLRSIQHGRLPGYRLAGIVSDAPSRIGRNIRGVPILGNIDDIPAIVQEHDVREVVVAERPLRPGDCQQAALVCLRLGCRVTNETTFFETAFGEVPVSHITPGWFYSADLSGQREEHAALKRLFDLTTSFLILLVTLPLWPFLALLIRLQDGGPVFYAQSRVGQAGRVFRLYKFRTMSLDAEVAGCTWSGEHDPRVTRFGRFLRTSRLDELPQLWNVLRGEMSMVGPRPERPDIVEPLSQLIPYYHERHMVKPGLTGWAQICYRYGSSVADARRKLQFDLYYIKHMSLELDVIILLRTFGTLLLGMR